MSWKSQYAAGASSTLCCGKSSEPVLGVCEKREFVPRQTRSGRIDCSAISPTCCLKCLVRRQSMEASRAYQGPAIDVLPESAAEEPAPKLQGLIHLDEQSIVRYVHYRH